MYVWLYSVICEENNNVKHELVKYTVYTIVLQITELNHKLSKYIIIKRFLSFVFIFK